MAKFRCQGCGKVTDAEKEPDRCGRCGDNPADNGGNPVFKPLK